MTGYTDIMETLRKMNVNTAGSSKPFSLTGNTEDSMMVMRKTTFTKKVCEKLCKMGREARHVSLDDFLLGFGYMPVNEDGTFDMESIDGLDTALANETFRLLLTEGKADFPTFDFPNQRRGEKWNRVELGKSGIVMIEGIHSLNPLLTENLPTFCRSFTRLTRVRKRKRR